MVFAMNHGIRVTYSHNPRIPSRISNCAPLTRSRSRLTARRLRPRCSARSARIVASTLAMWSGPLPRAHRDVRMPEFLAEDMPHALEVLREYRTLADRKDVSRVGDVNPIIEDHTTRRRGEDENALRERDRLCQVVSYEDNRLAQAFPDLQELLVQEDLRMRVELPQRLLPQ